MKQLPKEYDHKKSEKYWQEQWVEKGTYHWHDDLPREQTFVIDTPPPTVSGVLHMGHIFSYTQADFIARYQRMAGKDVFYPMGFDDNGLPTERLVEKIKGVRGSAMPRADFVALCREVVKDAEEEFRKLFKSAALSVDWRQEYQTISDDVRKISQASFIDLLQKNQAYRDFRPTYWDWVDQTAIAQAEIENKEMPGVMNEIVFEVDGESWMVNGDKINTTNHQPLSTITIMTTRPELLGACVAVMYHPEDPNAAKYKGKHAITPLFGVKVPMIADEAVERDKGTGLVMCCTFGDDTDKEWVRKHGLPWRPIISQEGKTDYFIVGHEITFWGGKDGNSDDTFLTSKNTIDINKAILIFGKIQNLKPKQANAKIIELLQAEGKLLKQTPMTHTVKCAERSGTPIEIIPTYQWFVKIADKKEELLKKGTEVNWYPEYMRIRLNQWIEGLKEDWCISRQRFFGVPIPVWDIEIDSNPESPEYKTVYASLDSLPVDPLTTAPSGYEIIAHLTKVKLPYFEAREISTGKIVNIYPNIDVLDTWATSSISPQINAHAISGNDERFKKLFPADLRPQAHEIIRTWAFYTIAKAYLHGDTIPWKNIVISGWCLAADKTKMSKSKGNVVTPVALIEEKGTDAVRYWASTSRLGTDTAFSEDLLKIGRKLVNKIWNASQFASLNLSKIEGIPTTPAQDIKNGKINCALDIWILARLNMCVIKATKGFDEFEYCDARVAIEDFFWNDFCDNYLELVKARAYNENGENPDGQQSALYTLYHCLDAILRLFAPFVPHITEELYSHIFDDKYAKLGSIHARGNWVKVSDYPFYEYSKEAQYGFLFTAEQPLYDSTIRSGFLAVEVLNVIRKAKSEANVSIKFPVEEVHIAAFYNIGKWELLLPVLDDLKAAGNAKSITQSRGEGTLYTSEEHNFHIAVTLAKVAD